MRFKGLSAWAASCIALLGLSGVLAAQPPERFDAARERMVAQQLKGRDITDVRVLAAMGKVHRHRFVPEFLAPLAYEDHPLPIGSGQTISQPYIVALMTQWAALKPGDKVLEVGTGSGYQAAVLAEITHKVFSVELLPELAKEAAARLEALGYRQVQVKAGDGYQGWAEEAPFNVILVTAAAREVPPALAAQLAEGGRLVIPLGPPGLPQTLMLYRKVQGKLEEKARLPVRFVPLVKPGRGEGETGKRGRRGSGDGERGIEMMVGSLPDEVVKSPKFPPTRGEKKDFLPVHHSFSPLPVSPFLRFSPSPPPRFSPSPFPLPGRPPSPGPEQLGQQVIHRGRDSQGGSPGRHLGIQGLDLRSPARQHILEHGRAVGRGGLADLSQPGLRVAANRDACGPGHGLGFPGRGHRRLPGFRQLRQRPVGDPEQGGQGIDAHIDQQFFPQHNLDVRVGVAFQSGPLKQVHHPGDFGVGYQGTPGRADVDGPVSGMNDPALSGAGGPQEGRAGQHPLRSRHPGHGFQVPQTVLQSKDDASGSHERGQGPGSLCGLMSLHRHDDQPAGLHFMGQFKGDPGHP